MPRVGRTRPLGSVVCVIYDPDNPRRTASFTAGGGPLGRTDKAVTLTYEFRVMNGATRKGRSAASGKNAPAGFGGLRDLRSGQPAAQRTLSFFAGETGERAHPLRRNKSKRIQVDGAAFSICFSLSVSNSCSRRFCVMAMARWISSRASAKLPIFISRSPRTL